jgi:methionyl-tRNA synthetase
MAEHILVCTAWPYANGDQHLGHLAGNFIPADIFARYHRLKGNQVLMVSGSDAHGTPITVRADEEGIAPRELFQRYHERFLDTFIDLGISYDLFTHTDTENHYRVAQDVFHKCLDNGFVYKETQQQFFSPSQGRFLPDRYIEGTCPICGYEAARGDQCDNCKSLLDPTDLINPHARNDNLPLELRDTEHFFLNLAALSDDIWAYLNDDKDFWRPNVINYSRGYVKEGLKGRPITRDSEWGIPLPLDGYESKRLYVWFEAVIGYFSASIEWAANQGTPEAWKTWWYTPAAKTFYFMGKDNIPFHSIIWPGELFATGRRMYEDDPDKQLNLPYNVLSNEYLTMKGGKFSTSRSYAIWASDFLSRFDPDPLRYYLTIIAPEARDTDFTFDDFIRRNNDELVAAWGNLVNRMLGFARKNFNEQVPEPGELDELDRDILTQVEGGFDEVGDLIEAGRIKAALEAAMALARAANGYLDRKEPWKTIKTDRAAATTSVYVILRVIDNLKIILAPFLPATSQNLHEFLGYEGRLFGQSYKKEFAESTRSHTGLCYDPTDVVGRWEASQLSPGQALRQPAPLFKKLDPEETEAMLNELLGGKKN